MRDWCISKLCYHTFLAGILTLFFFFAFIPLSIGEPMQINLDNAVLTESSGMSGIRINGGYAIYSLDISEFYPWLTTFQLGTLPFPNYIAVTISYSNTDKSEPGCGNVPPKLYVKKKDQEVYVFLSDLNNSSDNITTNGFLIDCRDYVESNGSGGYRVVVKVGAQDCWLTDDAEIDVDGLGTWFYVDYDRYNYMYVDGSPKVVTINNADLGASNSQNVSIRNRGGGSATRSWGIRNTSPSPTWINAQSGSVTAGGTGTIPVEINSANISSSNVGELSGKLVPVYDTGFDPTARGLKGDFYHVPDPATSLGNLDNALDNTSKKLVYSNIFPTIEFHKSAGITDAYEETELFKSGTITTNVRRDFVAVFTGFINISSSGTYRFYVTSDDGFRLKVNGTTVTQYTSGRGTATSQGTISLQPGIYPIVLTYFQGYGGKSLTLEWEPPSQSRAVVPSSVLSSGLNILVCVNPLKPTVTFTTATGANNKVNVAAGQSSIITVSADRGSTNVDVTGFKWQKVTGSAGAGSSFDSTTVGQKSYPYTDPGNYTVYCKSVDAKGVESNLASIPVCAWNPPTVNNAPPQGGTASWYSGKYAGVVNQPVYLMAAGTLGANNPTDSPGESIQEFRWDLDNNWNEIELTQSAGQNTSYTWAAPNTAGKIRCKAVTNYGIESAERLFDLKVYDIVRANDQGPYNGRPTREVELTGSINTSSFAGAAFAYKWYVKSGTTFTAITTGSDGKAKYTWTTEGVYEVKFEGTVTTQEGLVLTGSDTTTVSVEAGVPTAMPGGPYRGGIAGGNYSPIQFEGNDPNYVEAEDIGKITEWEWIFDRGPDINCSESSILFAENADQMMGYPSSGTATIEEDIGFANSGDSALKVTPVGASESYPNSHKIFHIPDIYIVQNPVAANEFRYITFAWRKDSGTGIMIQLYGPPGLWNHRYHAGVNNITAWSPSIQVDAAIPTEWSIVTRDLYADWGAFTITHIALTPFSTAAYFDDIYFHKSPTLPIGVSCSVETRTLLAENADEMIGYLTDGTATIERVNGFANSGESAIKVAPVGGTSSQKYKFAISGWSFDIVENPVAANEFRYITFAWRKEGGTGIMLQIPGSNSWNHRYHAGVNNITAWSPSIQVDAAIPSEWQVVTRDLYADWGAFTVTGIALVPFSGTAGYFDDIYLHKSPDPPVAVVQGWKAAHAYRKAGRYEASLRVKSEMLKWSMVSTADVQIIDGRITGYVRAADLRTPVKNARLTLSSSHVDTDVLASIAARNSFKLHTNNDGSLYTLTDSLGYYSFDHIPLGSYWVVASKVEGDTIHNFENSGIKATELTLDAPGQLAIDFVDLSVFPISGRVVYSIQKNGVDVLVENVVIEAQPVGNANSIKSVPSVKSGNPTGGNYSLPLFSGQYLFLADRSQHDIRIKDTTPGYDYINGLVNIDRARTDIDFIDYTTRTLTVFVQDSGGYKISNKDIAVSGDNGQSPSGSKSDDADGKLMLTLPPGKYTVTVPGAQPETKETDLTGGDQAVTMTIPVPLVLSFDSRPKFFDVPDDFLAQFGIDPNQNPEGYMYYYPPEPRTHTYVLTATANGNPVDDFKLFITDEVSMMTGDPPEEQEIQVEGAEGRYVVTAGIPKIDLNEDPPLADVKRITFKAEKEGYVDSAPVTDSVIVLGDIGFGDPERIVSIPVVNYTVLHDPPGDGSYSFLDDSVKLKGIVNGITIKMKDKEVPVYPSPWRDERSVAGFTFEKEPGSDTTFKDMEDAGLMGSDRTVMPAAGAFSIAAVSEAAVGFATVVMGPFAWAVQSAMIPVLGVSLEAGTAIPGYTGVVQYEVSPSRHLETPSGDSLTDLVGAGKGDIYFGEGWTLGLRNTYRLGMKLVNNQWQLQTQQIMTYQILERTNQYIYTIRDILDIIENLDIAIAGATDEDEITKLTNARNTWQGLLDKNLAYKWQRDYVSEGKSFEEFKSYEGLPESSENLIFSAGPTFEYSRTINEGITTTVSVNVGVASAGSMELRLEVHAGFYWYGNGIVSTTEMAGSAEVNSSTEYGAEWESGREAEQTVGFVLNDDDIGDNISAHVYADPVWGTPIFFQDQGSVTSDPWEAGTQKAVDLTLELLEQPSGTFDYQDGAHYKVKVQYAGLRELETNWVDFVIYDLWTDNGDNMTVRFNGQPGPYAFSLGKQAPTVTFVVSLYPPEKDQAGSEEKEYSVVIEVDEVDDCYQVNRVVTLSPEFADLRAPRATIEAPYSGQRVSPVFFPTADPFRILAVSEDTDLATIQLQIRTKQPNGVLEPWRNLSGMLWEDGGSNPNVEVFDRLNRVPPRREFTFKWTDAEIAALGVGEYYIRAVATDKATTPNTDINPPDVMFLVDDSKPTVLTTIPDYQERESQRIYRGELSAVFTDDMRADDFSDRTFMVTDLLNGNEQVAGFVSYSPALRKAIFVPVVPFDPNGFYRVEIKTDTVVGGETQRGVHDLAGNPLDNVFMFTFHTLDTPFEPTWSITLSVTNGTAKDTNNIAAVEYGALDVEDEKDALSAPVQATQLRLSFLDRDEVEYDRDIRPADGRLSHHWFFVVSNADNGTGVTIKWKPSIYLISTTRQYQVIRLVEFNADGTVNSVIPLDPTDATVDPTTGQINEMTAYTYTNAGEESRYFRLDVQKADLVATTLQKGTSDWKFLSVPITPQRADPFVNLGDDIDPLQLYKYDTELQGYKIYPLDLGEVSLQTGYGYFTRLKSSTEVDVGGTSNLVDIFLYLDEAGWHAIGNPFILPVNVADLRINNGTFANAVSNGLVEGTLYRWKVGSPDSYEAITSASQLLPWEGYWIKTTQPGVSLIIPAPAGIGTATAPLPPSFDPPIPMAPPMVKPLAAGQFDLRLELISSFSSDVTTTFGARDNAQMGWDMLDQSEPPTLSQTLSIYFDHTDWGNDSGIYNTDYQPTMKAGEERIWTFTVFTDKAGTEMNLSWANAIAQIPGDIVLYFRRADDQSDWQDMREIQSVNLVSQSLITKIPFEMKAQRFAMSPVADAQVIAGEKQAILRWKPDNNEFITGYVITRQEGSAQDWRDGEGVRYILQQNPVNPVSQFADADLLEEVTYTYQIGVQFRSGAILPGELLTIKTLPVIKTTVLLQNYPNPFNPEVWIPYDLAEEASVSIEIYSVSGQLVRALDLGVQQRGRYASREKAAYWDGMTQFGEKSASGVYFYVLKAGKFSASKKMILVR